MVNIVGLLVAAALFALIHESLHAFMAVLFGEYGSFQVHWYGFEVIYRTPLEAREGVHWALIAGLPNVVTILLGYLLYSGRNFFARQKPLAVRIVGYWTAVIFLIADPLNLSIGPFIYGGDVGGIAHGLGVSRYMIQVVAFGVFLLNRELIATRLLAAYGIATAHPLFRPWLPLRGAASRP